MHGKLFRIEPSAAFTQVYVLFTGAAKHEYCQVDMLRMTKPKKGMKLYNPNPEIGFGCASCIHNKEKCTTLCESNSSGGTRYEWNGDRTRAFWIRRTKSNAY